MCIGRRHRVASTLMLIVGWLPIVATAQSEWFVTPSVTLAEVYDDNLFGSGFGSASQPEDDLISRVSPSIEVEHRSAGLTFTGRYAQDAEWYRRHPELDTSRARQHGATGIRLEASPRLTLSGEATYTETETPGDLNLTTGLEPARAHAERFVVAPALKYALDPLTFGTATYTFTRDQIAGGVGTDAHMATLGWERRLTRRDTVLVGYGFQRFLFDDDTSADVHLLTVGGTHAFTDRTSGTILSGPRRTDGSSDFEFSGSLRHAFQQGELSVNYARSQTTALGSTGVVETQSAGANLVYSPVAELEVRLGPSWVKSEREALEADVYRTTFDARYRLTRQVTLFGTYHYSTQQGSLDVPGDVEIERNLIMLGVRIAPPPRPGATRSGSEAPTPEVER